MTIALPFRSRLFLSTVLVAAVSVIVAGALMSISVKRQMDAQIQAALLAQVRLVAELVAQPGSAARDPQDLATALGATTGARVTFVAADGRVTGDSAEDRDGLATLDNHAARPEIAAARQSGLGVARRHSTTVDKDLLYIAVPVRHPAIAFVRLALPLVAIERQLAAVRQPTLAALAIALGAAILLAGAFSMRLAQRVSRVAEAARRYETGDLAPPAGGLGGDELGLVAETLDRSARELGRRADELARDRARMDAVLSGMAEGVLVIDASGRLRRVNEAARRLLGLAGDTIARPYMEAIRHPGVIAQVRAALAGDVPPGEELTLTTDSARTLVARAAPIEHDGHAGAVLVLHDVTDLRRADQARRDFVANVSHELRTPLTAIRGYLEALLDGDLDAADARRFLGVIATHTGRMEGLVRDLLRLARLDAGQERAERTTVRADALFADGTDQLETLIAQRALRVVTTIDPPEMTIAGDAQKLRDVVRNLVENAAIYSPHGATVRLDARREGGDIVLGVADEGPGIPPAELARVFERFYRVEKSRARDPGGTGLGLAIVRHLVGLHGGSVSAANQPGGGAVFTVRLPEG